MTKLLVACDAHLYRMPDNSYWCGAVYDYGFWERYLDVFDEVRVVSRVKDVDTLPSEMKRVDGKKVEVWDIPFFRGPKQLVKSFQMIQKKLRGAYSGCDAALFRMPSQTAQMAYWQLPYGMPFAGEIVANPHESAHAPSASLFRKMINRIISRQLKSFCMRANGVAYVTCNALQEQYPSRSILEGENEYYFSSYYSTAALGDDAYGSPRKYSGFKHLTVVMTCLSMNTESKGERTFLSAVAAARQMGYNIQAKIIGDGTLRKEFEDYAESLGIRDHVVFTGLLRSPHTLRRELLDADLFVFPTQSEGLPRGMIEAMALGLPVLSTPVGGIPELIQSQYLFDPMDGMSFAEEICRLFNSPRELETMSSQNYHSSLDFRNSILQSRRVLFYQKLLNLTLIG